MSHPYVEATGRVPRTPAGSLILVAVLAAGPAGLVRAQPSTGPYVPAAPTAGPVLPGTGSLAAAERAAAHAVEAARASKDAAAVAIAEIALGAIRSDRGDYGGALGLVLPHAHGSGDVPATVVSAANAAAARIHQLRGDAARAGTALRRTTSLPAPAAAGLLPPDVVRGLVESTAGRPDAAVTLLAGVLEGQTVAPGSPASVTARTALGRGLVAQRRYSDADETLAAAVAEARRAGLRLELAEARQAQGELWRVTGDSARSEAALLDALTIARDVDLPRVIAPVGYALYESAAARGDHAASVEYLRLHSEARLRLTGEAATQRVVDVLVHDAAAGSSGEADEAAAASPATAAASTGTDDRADVVRNSLLGASLSALMLAAVLWRVGYTRGKRALHYRQELEALKGAVTTVSALDGLLTICASCKDVCSETGEWTRVEDYLAARTDARFTHSVCPTCEQRVLAAAEYDLDLLSAAGAGGPSTAGGRRARPAGLSGGFDWPPTDEELARVLESADRDQDRRGGRWS